MSNKIYKLENSAYLQSEAVHVFPCSGRGYQETSKSPAKVFDPEAKYTTEHNLTAKSGHITDLVDSYIDSWSSAGPLICCINGYYFNANLTLEELINALSPTPEVGTSLFAKIRLEKRNIYQPEPVTTETINEITEALANQVSQNVAGSGAQVKSSTDLDNAINAEDLTTYYFTGLSFLAAKQPPITTNVNFTEHSLKLATYTGTKWELNTKVCLDYLLKIHTDTGAISFNNCTATGDFAFATGNQTGATGNYSHAEGINTIAAGKHSHAEGDTTEASGESSHTEGISTGAFDRGSHAEGISTLAVGAYSHAEGHGGLIKIDGQAGIPPIVEENTTEQPGAYLVKFTCAKTSTNILIPDLSVILRGASAAGDKITVQAHIGVVQTVPDNPNTHKVICVCDDPLIMTATEVANFIIVDRSLIAKEAASHAEGKSTMAVGKGAHTEGRQTVAFGENSHAEGYSTKTAPNGLYSHAEGKFTIAIGEQAHAEGDTTTASGQYSHAEGYSTKAREAGSHAEGFYTEAIGKGSHAEGNSTLAIGDYSHAEGDNTIASGDYSHAAGFGTAEAMGPAIRSLDWDSEVPATLTITGYSSFESDFRLYDLISIPYLTTTDSISSFIAVIDSVAGSTIICSRGAAKPDNYKDKVEDQLKKLTGIAFGNYSQVLGDNTIASGDYSCAEGEYAKADGRYSHAEGSSGAFGDYSHAEGDTTEASGDYSHTEGSGTFAKNQAAHAEGYATNAEGDYSHAEGEQTFATNQAAHAEGYQTRASGAHAHAEGIETSAINPGSHAEGLSTQTSADYQHVSGKYNADNKEALLIVGNGTAESARSNILEVESNTAKIKGNLINGNSTNAATNNSHAEGTTTEARGNYSHAEGNNTEASGDYSHAEGQFTIAQEEGQHVSGKYNANNKDALVIVGNGRPGDTSTEAVRSNIVEVESDTVKVNGNLINGSSTNMATYTSHAEGNNTEASGDYSHAEGNNTEASEDYSHAEGKNTTASGKNSHAEGSNTSTGTWEGAHVEGIGTIAGANYQHVSGHYNDITPFPLVVIGNGSGNDNRSNIIEVHDTKVNINGALNIQDTSGSPLSVGATLDDIKDRLDKLGFNEGRIDEIVTVNCTIRPLNSSHYPLPDSSYNPPFLIKMGNMAILNAVVTGKGNDPQAASFYLPVRFRPKRDSWVLCRLSSTEAYPVKIDYTGLVDVSQIGARSGYTWDFVGAGWRLD